MYYVVHLAVPIIFAALYVLGTGAIHSVIEFLTVLPKAFAVFSIPYWVWGAISSYVEASKMVVVAGFIGLHLLWAGCYVLVFTSESKEAANGWFLFFLGSPIAVSLGAFVGYLRRR